MAEPTKDELKEKAKADYRGALRALDIMIGDRLGLLVDLAWRGEATATELHERTGVNRKTVTRWLTNMATARYVKKVGTRYSLTPDAIEVLVKRGGPDYSAELARFARIVSHALPALARAQEDEGGLGDVYQEDEGGAADRTP